MDFKKLIVKMLHEILRDNDISFEQIDELIETPKEKTNGDYSLPCFRLAKTLKKPPIQIADEIKEKINIDGTYIEKIENVNGFLNFYISKIENVKNILENFEQKREKYGKAQIGNGQTVIIEFSSPNIAKPFHIGHLKTTIIGNSLYKIYKFLGYNVIGDNHLGDYGTQFAKLIVAYDKWGEEYDYTENAIDKLAELYVRINQECEENPDTLELCRETFKKLEDNDPHCIEIWKKFKEWSLLEFNEIYDLLGVKFDTMYGEAFFASMMGEVIELLDKSSALVESEGAKIVDLSNDGIETPIIIQKANGSSIYATRDLATILFRTREFDFSKCIYVVGNEQSLYFKQIFATSKYLGIDEKYVKGLEHVSYGLIRLPEGKMSSRKGNFVKVKELIEESISKVKEIIEDRDIDNKDLVAKQVGVGAVIFDDLKESRIKEQVFDLEAALNFNGETGPYLQYTTVRTKSVLEKAGYVPNLSDVNYDYLCDESAIDVINMISRFPKVLISVMEKNEPSYLSRFLLDLAKKYSNFYNNNKIICNEREVQDARLYLTYMVKIVLNNGLKLLGIDIPSKM